MGDTGRHGPRRSGGGRARSPPLNLYHALEAFGIMVAGLLFYSYTYNLFPLLRPESRHWRVMLYGAAFGALTVALMIARIEVADGVFIDARVVPVAIIGLFEGWPAALIAAMLGAIYRVSLGGSGTLPGVFGLVATAVAAGIIHGWAHRRGGVGAQHAFTLTALACLISIASFALLGPRGVALLGLVWVPHVATLVVGIGFMARLFRDVAVQQSLAAAQERFRAIIDEATDAIRIVDPHTRRILECNRADCEISGYSRQDMIGRDVRDFWPDEPGPRAIREATYAEAVSRGQANALGAPYRTRSGRIIAVDSSRRIVRHQGRDYMIVIYRDAAERLRAEATLREAAELRSATLLARAAAHEINNPLAAIVGALQLMADSLPPDSRERSWARRGLEASARIGAAVTRLSNITRVVSAPYGEGVPPMLDTEKSSGRLSPPNTEPLRPAAPAELDQRG
jgi:PAS domain S-box-containing protein